MKDKFTVNFDNLSQTLLPQTSYRLVDVQHRIEKVAYDLVRFRDNEDTDQLWKIQDGIDGPVIVALYGEDGGLAVESTKEKSNWDALPDKSAMHIYYKGEPLVSLSSKDMGIPETEFNVARRWLPKKLASDESLQKEVFSKLGARSCELICQRFPELRKVADWTPEDLTSEEIVDDDPPNWLRQELIEPDRRHEGFAPPQESDEDLYEDVGSDGLIAELVTLYDEGRITKEKLEGALKKLVANVATTNIKRGK